MVKNHHHRLVVLPSGLNPSPGNFPITFKATVDENNVLTTTLNTIGAPVKPHTPYFFYGNFPAAWGPSPHATGGIVNGAPFVVNNGWYPGDYIICAWFYGTDGNQYASNYQTFTLS